jgi:hypothetical protein
MQVASSQDEDSRAGSSNVAPSFDVSEKSLQEGKDVALEAASRILASRAGPVQLCLTDRQAAAIRQRRCFHLHMKSRK